MIILYKGVLSTALITAFSAFMYVGTVEAQTSTTSSISIKPIKTCGSLLKKLSATVFGPTDKLRNKYAAKPSSSISCIVKVIATKGATMQKVGYLTSYKEDKSASGGCKTVKKKFTFSKSGLAEVEINLASWLATDFYLEGFQFTDFKRIIDLYLKKPELVLVDVNRLAT